MNTHAHERVWQESTAKNGPRLVHLCLGRYANDRDVSYPGNETLESETRLSKRSVQEGLRKLVDIGEIVQLEGLSEYATRKWQLFPHDGDADSSRIAQDVAPRVSPTTSNGDGDSLSAESAPPAEESASFEDDAVDRVRRKLARACARKRTALPSREAVATVLEAYPDRDAERVAEELCWWCEHGNGSGRQIKNMASQFRTFMRVADPGPVSSLEVQSKYDRIANA